MKTDGIIIRGKKVKSSPVRGFVNTLRAFSLAKGGKGLAPYFILPFILNIAVLSAAFYFSYTTLLPMADSFLAGDSWYMSLLRALVSPVIFLFLTVITIFIYSIVGGIISAPFLDLLSEKTEKVLGAGEVPGSLSFKELIADILRAAGNSIRLLVLILFVNIFLLLLNIIPGGSFLYAFLNFIAALFFYGFQFYDFPLERRSLTFGEKMKVTMKFKWSVMGTGFAFFLLSFIPVVGFLGLNLCTVGAAMTFVEDIKPVLNVDVK